ncbi:MAG: hypothetical protein ACI32Q_04085 [Intestinibaculum porci]|uniref:hypothetical protein n=1 Tax=Intestinibaculum porci TaxID=2487118 RepID=UPI003F0AF136
MSKKYKAICLISLLILYLNLLYIRNYLGKMNIVYFLLICVLSPIILFSIIVSFYLRFLKRINSFLYILFTGLSSFIYSGTFYLFIKNNLKNIKDVILNSEVNSNLSLSITQLKLENNFSSYVFVFLLVTVLSVSFTALFDKYFCWRK